MNICKSFAAGNITGGLTLLDNSNITDQAFLLSQIGKNGPIAMTASIKPASTDANAIASIKRILTIGTQPGQGFYAKGNRNNLFCYADKEELTYPTTLPQDYNKTVQAIATSENATEKGCPKLMASGYSPELGKLAINNPVTYKTVTKRFLKKEKVSRDYFTPYEIALANANYPFIEAMNELRKSATPVLFINYQLKETTKDKFVLVQVNEAYRRPISIDALTLEDFMLPRAYYATNRGTTLMPGSPTTNFLKETDIAASRSANTYPTVTDPTIEGLNLATTWSDTYDRQLVATPTEDQRKIINLLADIQAEMVKQPESQEKYVKMAEQSNISATPGTRTFATVNIKDVQEVPYQGTLADCFPCSKEKGKCYDGPMISVEYAFILYNAKNATATEAATSTKGKL
jgi:hypothetical protein